MRRAGRVLSRRKAGARQVQAFGQRLDLQAALVAAQGCGAVVLGLEALAQCFQYAQEPAAQPLAQGQRP
jgi:hypothetical protein